MSFILRCGVLGPLLWLAAAGCAVHAPMSETLLFHDPRTAPRHRNASAAGAAFTYAPSLAAVEEAARRQSPEIAYRVHDLRLNPSRFSGGAYLTRYTRRGWLALSATLGLPVAGIDATLRLGHRHYLTAAYSAPGQVQAHYLHRAFNSPYVGAAVGVGYRRDLHAFSQPTECMMCLSIEHVDVRSVGLRGLVLYRGERGLPAGIRLGVFAGYAPKLDGPLLDLTLTFGRF